MSGFSHQYMKDRAFRRTLLSKLLNGKFRVAR
jgi:hypothetical protein